MQPCVIWRTAAPRLGLADGGLQVVRLALVGQPGGAQDREPGGLEERLQPQEPLDHGRLSVQPAPYSIATPAAASCSRVKSSAASAMPSPIAETSGRVMLKVFITSLKPPLLSFGILSLPPSRLLRGIRQSLKT